MGCLCCCLRPESEPEDKVNNKVVNLDASQHNSECDLTPRIASQ